MSAFRVLLDANVLFPFSLRDTLLRAAAADFFQLYWSEQILEEVRRSLVRTGTIKPNQADRLLRAMTDAFPDALVTGNEALLAEMENDPGDRHVAAAARRAGAQRIATRNIRHFKRLPLGIEAQDPDAFLCDLLALDPDALIEILHAQAAALRRPARTFDQLVAGLAKIIPDFVRAVRNTAT